MIAAAASRGEKDTERLVTMTTKNTLPEDLIIEILSWLPGKPLLRFKLVCKSWFAMITCKDFAAKHLNNYYNNTNNGRLLAHYHTCPEDPHWIELYQDETLVDVSYEVHDLTIPAGHLCGPCNGIFYLDISRQDCGLWNPTTREYRALPAKLTKPDLPPNVGYSADVYGFGWDPLTKDYKVVIISELYHKRNYYCYYPLPVIVYTLGTDSWRHWGHLDKHYELDDTTCYTYLNGVFYWSGTYKRNIRLILSFNLGSEVFEKIQAPDYPQTSIAQLALFLDSIAVFSVCQIEQSLDIWVMIEGCWTKKFSIGPLLGVWCPVGYWKNGKVFLKSNKGDLLLFDPSAQETRNLGYYEPICHCELLVYKESLISIKDRIGFQCHEEHHQV